MQAPGTGAQVYLPGPGPLLQAPDPVIMHPAPTTAVEIERPIQVFFVTAVNMSSVW